MQAFSPEFDLVCSKYNLERSTRVPKHCCEIRLLIWILSAVNMHCKEKSQHKINQPSVKAFPAGLCFPRQTCTSGCPMCLRVRETEKACWNIDEALTFLHSQHQKQHGMSLRGIIIIIIIPHPSLSHPLSCQQGSVAPYGRAINKIYLYFTAQPYLFILKRLLCPNFFF